MVVTSRTSTTILFYLFIVLNVLRETGANDHQQWKCGSKNRKLFYKWLQNNGSLNSAIEEDIRLDLAHRPEVIKDLNLFISTAFHTNMKTLLYMSLAYNDLERIPMLNLNNDNKMVTIAKDLKYLTLMGNDFSEKSKNGIRKGGNYNYSINITSWSTLQPVTHSFETREKSGWATDLGILGLANLLELDLRYCQIDVIYNNTFIGMKKLRYLYLSDNNIYEIEPAAFARLGNLQHLDLSSNVAPDSLVDVSKKLLDGLSVSRGAFYPLQNLISLDMSHTKVSPTFISSLHELGRSLQRLSICQSRIISIKGAFRSFSLKYLDISGNIGVQGLDEQAFDGIENTLKVLHARYVSMTSLNSLRKLKRLTAVSLTGNNIAHLNKSLLQEMSHLVFLDISDNRISSWYNEVLLGLENLRYLLLQNNNINLLSPAMLKDLNQIQYLALGRNEFVCNCYLRHFIDTAIDNANKNQNGTDYKRNFSEPLSESLRFNTHNDLIYGGALDYYYKWVTKDDNFIIPIEKTTTHNLNEVLFYDTSQTYDNISQQHNLDDFNFTYVLIDYSPWEYACTDSKSNQFITFTDVPPCKYTESNDYEGNLNQLALYVSLGVFLFVCKITGLVIWKWWYVRYFFMTIKNATILSRLTNEDSMNDPDKLYYYDVFVSYCNEDRSWVLDDLLPHIEKNKNINVCLHERDFQVGLSILENIISAIDRSRTILLIVSQVFLLSQWCQFEMHLAQHRLLETRRENLILVLLEDIPKRKRPNTLQYLMMTKTFLAWPKSGQQDEVVIFWKRLRKALVQGKYRSNIDRISRA